MSAYRPFRRAEHGFTPATFATVATLGRTERETVANVATVAGHKARTSASEAQTVANVANVAGVERKPVYPPRRVPSPYTPATLATFATVPETPAGWREALLALSPDRDPCPGWRADAWGDVWLRAFRFLDEHGEAALALGWSAAELFGVHPVVGVRRVDCAGALMLCGGSPVALLAENTVCFANGLVYRRAPIGPAVPVWEFGRPEEGMR